MYFLFQLSRFLSWYQARTGFGSWKPCNYCDHLAWRSSFSLFGFLHIKLLEGLPTESGRSIGESSISGTSHRTVFWVPAAMHLLKQFGINRKTLNIALEKHSHFDTDPFLPLRLWMYASLGSVEGIFPLFGEDFAGGHGIPKNHWDPLWFQTITPNQWSYTQQYFV